MIIKTKIDKKTDTYKSNFENMKEGHAFWVKRRAKEGEESNWPESETLEKVKRKINLLDQCFLEHAERNENDTKTYYRGMQWGYGDYKNAKVGDKVLIQNFTSVSTVKKEAEYFKRGKNA